MAQATANLAAGGSSQLSVNTSAAVGAANAQQQSTSDLSSVVSAGNAAGNQQQQAAAPAAQDEKYVVRPSYKDMFKPKEVKAIMREVLKQQLDGKKYNQNETGAWTKDIAAAIKTKLKELDLKRYKFLVQVVIGEMKGAGVRMGARCLWDQQTDKTAEETYVNDSLFCVAVAFGVYLY